MNRVGRRTWQWQIVLAGLASILLAGLVQATVAVDPSQAALDRHEAYLMVMGEATPAQMTPDELGQMQLLDLKYGLAAGASSSVWLHSVGDGIRYRLSGDQNTDAELTLLYRDGSYRGRIEQLSSGKSVEYRLYPLKRVDLTYYHGQRLLQRDMFYSRRGKMDAGFVHCSLSYAPAGDKAVTVRSDLTGKRRTLGVLADSDQGDVLVFTPQPERGLPTLYSMEYALVGNQRIRFAMWLDGATPANHGDESLHASLDRIYECKADADGNFQPPEPLGNWLQQRLQAQQEKQ
ncbi:hypothetical protein [Pseudomaricurvus sp. HS19]|uniref:hypothetical protein n=1 Tax=Pseudomaricurvus sp. HS19 TaxID=2692626 RepID=UPI0013711CF6|nr:hypothetical protein [Pseudomaricurvus sp. HS19]MYM64351.1 hypothetical protein [Pseudomaricurvus sp. HS19]